MDMEKNDGTCDLCDFGSNLDDFELTSDQFAHEIR